MKTEAEDSLARDDLLQLEEDLAGSILDAETALAPCLEARAVISAPSGLDFDFSQDPFPRLGGGPVTFWGGSYAEADGHYPDLGIAGTAAGVSYS